MIGLLSSEIFYQLNPLDENTTNKNPVVAKIIEAHSGSQRKMQFSELWQDLKNGDEIYLGDSIRTGEKYALLLQFEQEQRRLALEANSLLEIANQEGELKLELFDGQLMLKQEQKNNKTISNIQANAQNALSQELSFAQWQPEQESKIQIIEPKAQSVFYVNPQQNERIKIKWAPIAKKHSMELWLGDKSKNLKLIRSNDPNSSQLDSRIGQLYWKLKLKNELGEIIEETPIFTSGIEARYPPSPLTPLDKAVLRLKTLSENIKIKYFINAGYDSSYIEVYSDAELKNMILKSENPEQQEVILSNLKEQTYYWRVFALASDTKKYLQSPIYSFNISLKSQMRQNLAWDLQLNSLQNYLGETPILNLSWAMPSSLGIQSFRVKIVSENEKLENAIPEVIRQNSLSKKMSKPGRYLAQIEALDQDNEVLAVSSLRKFDLQSLPPLQKIELISHSGRKLEANEEGLLKVQWQGIENSVYYRVQLIDSNAQIILNEDINSTEKTFEDLLPGSYQLKIVAVDKFQRTGLENLAWNILVPEAEFLASPKFKKMEIE